MTELEAKFKYFEKNPRAMQAFLKDAMERLEASLNASRVKFQRQWPKCESCGSVLQPSEDKDGYKVWNCLKGCSRV